MANSANGMQLVDLMKKMVWERALHEQMSFSKQGRLGFMLSTWGEKKLLKWEPLLHLRSKTSDFRHTVICHN